MKIRNILMPLFVLFFLSPVFFSCQNPFVLNNNTNDGNLSGEDQSITRIAVKGDSFTLAWDPPAEGNVTEYKLYFRLHGDEKWIKLDKVDGTSTQYTVTYPELDYGEYDFAVTSLYSDSESEYHTSLEQTAKPETGWFLDWQKN
jgi:hypothetical protein